MLKTYQVNSRRNDTFTRVLLTTNRRTQRSLLLSLSVPLSVLPSEVEELGRVLDYGPSGEGLGRCEAHNRKHAHAAIEQLDRL